MSSSALFIILGSSERRMKGLCAFESASLWHTEGTLDESGLEGHRAIVSCIFVDASPQLALWFITQLNFSHRLIILSAMRLIICDSLQWRQNKVSFDESIQKYRHYCFLSTHEVYLSECTTKVEYQPAIGAKKGKQSFAHV